MVGARLFARLSLIKGLVPVGILLHAAVGHAQVTTSGLGTAVITAPSPTGGTQFNITGGTRPGGGPNLFHSLGLFSIGSKDIASFNNTAGSGIVNVLGRVTGGQPSNISGKIQTTDFGTANLYLINPAGVIFGPTASLSVGGAFRVSTADYVRFPDLADGTQVRFLATASPLPSSGLTVDPTAFGFLSANPPAISVKGSLTVGTGKTLSLVGGEAPFPGKADTGLKVEGPLTLRAPGGRIEIVSVASPREVPLTGDPNVGSSAGLGQMNISNRAILTASSPAGAGTVLIRGGRLIVDNSSILADTTGSVNGAQLGIDLRAAEVILRGGALVRSQSLRDGDSGNVAVTATDSVTISGSSRIVSETLLGRGDGGRVTISAPSVTLNSAGSITSRTSGATLGAGSGGDIVMDVERLNVTGGKIESLVTGLGKGGNMAVRATESVTLSGISSGIFSSSLRSDPQAQGAGDISVEAHNVAVTGRAEIRSGSPIEQGANVTVTAKDSVIISGKGGISSQAFNKDVGDVAISATSLVMDDGFIRASTRGQGDAGNISVNARSVSLARGSQIASSSELPLTTGRGGNVTVTATESVNISGGSGLFSTAEGMGRGGNITVEGRDVMVQNGATISATSSRTGDAGNIALVIGDTLRMVGSEITTEALSAVGGNISIITTGSMLHLTDSRITTSVQGGVGRGGDITMGSTSHPVEFILLNHSPVRADAFGGPGGNISIAARVFLAGESPVTASSALSVSGTIDIQADVTDVSGSLAQLPEAILQAAALLRAACAARLAGGKTSTLVVAGREGLPLEPGGLLPSPLMAEGPPGGGLSRGAEHQWERVAAERYRLVAPSAVLHRRCSR